MNLGKIIALGGRKLNKALAMHYLSKAEVCSRFRKSYPRWHLERGCRRTQRHINSMGRLVGKLPADTARLRKQHRRKLHKIRRNEQWQDDGP